LVLQQISADTPRDKPNAPTLKQDGDQVPS
jgi:hypothetical protein